MVPHDRTLTLGDKLSWVAVCIIAVYVFWRTFDKSTERMALLVRWIITVLVLWMTWQIAIVHFTPFTPLKLALPLVILGVMWAPSIGGLMTSFLAGSMTGGDDEVDRKPFYFTAEGKRRKGLFQEAIIDIEQQLVAFPGDYDGHLRKASIQMENLKDFPAAESTLEEFLAIDGNQMKHVVAALHLLADWKLQHLRDGIGAAASLQRVVQLYPNTTASQAAEQRIARLSSFDETIKARHETKYSVKSARREEIAVLAESTEDPAQQVEALVQQLTTHPNDAVARETLASVYAEQCGRLDLATEQVEHLIGMPGQTARQTVHWLNLLATLHIRTARDRAAAERALRRVIDGFPTTAYAELAQARLAGLANELKGGASITTKTIGLYEKDLGINPKYRA